MSIGCAPAFCSIANVFSHVKHKDTYTHKPISKKLGISSNKPASSNHTSSQLGNISIKHTWAAGARNTVGRARIRIASQTC